jgi:hypothetical protein
VKIRLFTVVLAAAFLAVMAFPASAADNPTPLIRGHAHNDYLNSAPLTGALGHGFTSIEADVNLRYGADGRANLILCHEFRGQICVDDEERLAPQRAFVPTYLQGLQTWINAHGGRVYPGYTPVVYLFVELKCHSHKIDGADTCTDNDSDPASATSANNPLVVLKELESELTNFHSFLYSQTNTGAPVQVVVTGGHNDQPYARPGGGSPTTVRATLHAESPHWVYLDGGLGDAGTADGVVPLISFEYPATTATPTLDHQKCGIDESELLTQEGVSTSDTVDKILQAHLHGHKVRVYGLPDCPSRTSPTDTATYRNDREEAWWDVRNAGVDYIAGNHLELLGTWLTASYNSPGLGGGSCTGQQTVPANAYHGQLTAQHCSVWTGNVPVYSFRDDENGSTVVGRLTTGGSANWFVAQTQGAEMCVEPQGYCTNWWAWTQADNHAWGWVPVAYFSGGGVGELPADRLAACYDPFTLRQACQPS